MTGKLKSIPKLMSLRKLLRLRVSKQNLLYVSRKSLVSIVKIKVSLSGVETVDVINEEGLALMMKDSGIKDEGPDGLLVFYLCGIGSLS